jgi:simple sugar transport system ATP-binding protein
MSAKVLILDEPTSSLDAGEVQILFGVIRQLTSRGIGILLITHFLDQVYEISDRITVLRNGRKISEHRTSELPRMQLISEMLGKEMKQELEEGKSGDGSEIAARPLFIDVKGFSKRGVLAPFDLQVRQGEIVGLAGLLGAGRTETALLLFGVMKSEHGQARVKGVPVSLNSPRDAVRHGFAMLPEDRKVEGIIGELTVRENIILAIQAKLGWLRRISTRRQEELADEMIKALHIATPDSRKRVQELSGGNQQKVILARWLVSNPEFLILDEPTRGIDVGAHAEIISIIKRLCKQGMALLVISSELAELVDYSDRVIVLRDRKQVGELTGEDISQAAIMQAIAEK